MMVEKEIGEIGRMGRLKKQKEDGMKSRKVEDGIGNIRRTHGIWKKESRNVDANRESLRSVDVVRGMSAESALRARDVECWRREKR
jgi:hypothetical protein